ncbi:MAG: Maf family protein [Clostridium sp.]|nr:Maf family protein [Clostridium sp.]
MNTDKMTSPLNTKRRILLASQSPRRRELLSQAGFVYEVEPSQVEEHTTRTIPWEIVMELSRQKALDISRRHKDPELLVVGADTIVAYGDRILGKPHSAEAAVEMLTLLQGSRHQVYTGVTLVWTEQGEERIHTFYEKTEVEFYPMSQEEIYRYVDTGDCMDKAGAYGIQTQFGIYIKGIHGDYNNVVGLPIAALYQEMKRNDLL